MLAGVVAVGDALRCYAACGTTTLAGTDDLACDSSKEVDCSSGEVCATVTYSFKRGGSKVDVSGSLCGAKGSGDTVCDSTRENENGQGSISEFTCDMKFCETALCNSGFTAHVSFLVLSAGVLVFGLF